MDPNRADFFLLWKGRQSGPFSLAGIREQLASGEINRMHQISVGGRWLVLGEFLEQQDGGPVEARRRAEAAQRQAEGAQREDQLRREFEARLAAERAQQSALQERLADAEKQTHRPSWLPQTSPDHPPPPPLTYAPVAALQPALRSAPPSGDAAPAGGGPGDSDPLMVPARTSGLAVAAFVLSLCNLIPGVNLITWIVAIILGHIALAQTDRDPALGGRRLAIAALIITYSLLALGLIVFLVASIVYGFNLNRLLNR